MAHTGLKNSPHSVNSKGYNRRCFPSSRRTVCDNIQYTMTVYSNSTHQCTEYAKDLARQFEAYFANAFLDSSFCNNIAPQQRSKQRKTRLLQTVEQRSFLSNTCKNGTILTWNLQC